MTLEKICLENFLYERPGPQIDKNEQNVSIKVKIMRKYLCLQGKPNKRCTFPGTKSICRINMVGCIWMGHLILRY